MSKHDHRAAAGAPHVKAPRRREEPKRLSWRPVAIAGAVLALIGGSFVVPSLLGDEPAARQGGASQGDGPDIGSRIAFSERDVMTGREISSESLRGTRTLLFFSEGVMCQACFVQIQDIEEVGAELEQKGIALVSITPDPAGTLRQAISQYGIATPMIADDDRDMSAAFDTLGRGMHADTPGHAFVLLGEEGEVVWQRDYWLEPYETMYVEPARLLADLAPVTAAP